MVRTCLFLFLFSFSIFPYSFTGDFSAGIYWGSFPIATVISDSDSQILDQLETLTAQAVAQWEDAVGLLQRKLKAKELGPIRPWITEVEKLLHSRKLDKLIEQAMEDNFGSGLLGGSKNLGKENKLKGNL